jgi:hypothetical protein
VKGILEESLEDSDTKKVTNKKEIKVKKLR